MKISVVIPNYNSAGLVSHCVAALLTQALPRGDEMTVVVVDDGSTDGSADALADAFGDRIALVRLPENVGRSTARNRGADALPADLLIFIDSDCIPATADFVAAHVASVLAGADVSFGDVLTPGPGFWDRLQRDASAWRMRRFEAGDTWTFTTQNVAIRSDAFRRAGGFDEAFNRHGFEDRDLFIRLDQAEAVVRFTSASGVTHEDRISLASVSRKLGEAGFHASHLFAARHPKVYRTMSFSRLDVAARPWLRWVDALLWPVARPLAKGSAHWLEWRWIPFRLRALMARAVYGAWFLHGTVRHADAATTPA
jgi:GT2 family glycosyltransferase